MSEDITGDLDLLGDWLDAKGYTEEAGLCTRAMDEINKLRAALKPFSDEASVGPMPGQPYDPRRCSMKFLLAAAAALKETGE